MAQIPTTIVNEVISTYGSTITIISVTDSSYSDWGDANETTSSASITAIVNTLNQEDQYVQEGTFNAGDKVFFIKSDQTINKGDRIIHSDKTYEVKDIVEYELEDTIYVKEVKTRKV